MKIKSIHLDEDGLPESMEVVMSRDEAALIALVFDKRTGHDNEAVFPGADRQGSAIYAALDDLANRFWENGPRDMPTTE